MFRTLSRNRGRGRGDNRRPAGLEKFNRRVSFESLESRQLLSITFPTIGDQTVLAGAPLNLALSGSESSGDALSYTVSVSNSTLTNGAALTATVPTGNPSLKLAISDTGDNINGTMTFQLFQDLTPNTVEQIMNLVNDGFYNNLTFHRVISGFMIQGGDPNGNGTGGPGYKFDDEFNAALQFTSPGILAMANSGPDTNGSQFFVTVEPYRTGDFRYTIFGLLTSGSDILNAVDAVPVDSNDKPLHTVTITSATLFTDTQDGVLRLSAPIGTTGTASVTVTATDTVTNETTDQTFQVTVGADTNTDRPFLNSISPLTTNANTPVSFNIPTTNVDGDTMYYSGIVSPSNSNLAINLNSSTGSVTLTPTGGISGVYSIEVGVEAANASSSDTLAWDTQMVPVYINPAAPSGIQLTAASDTGSSQSDNLTDLNNTTGKTLQFQVNGVVSGALVQLFSDGTLIGSATASSTATSVTLTTNGTVTLTDGTHSITASQTLQNQAVNVGNLSTTTNLASPSSSALDVTVDTSLPQFNFTPVTTAVEGVAYTCQASASDTSGSALTYQLYEAPTGMTINAGTGLISWTPAVGQAGSSDVVVQATDTAGNVAQRHFTLDVVSANTAPALVPAAPLMGTTDENAPITINLAGTFINNGDGTTSITDADQNAIVGGIALIGTTGNGTWEYSLNGTTFQPVSTVSDSSALLLPSDAKLRYTPDGQNGETATITYMAWDTTSGTAGGQADLSTAGATGGTTAFSTTSDTASLTVNNVYDDLVLTSAGPSLGSTTPAAADTFSLTSFINNGAGTTTITDANQDGVVGGIALTGVSGGGTWSYSLDGAPFTSVGAVSASSALLLPGTAELCYTPSGTNSETATITYCAWDTTTGTSGAAADTTTNGGTTAFSLATDTASLIVNNAPVLTSGSPTLGKTDEDTTITIGLGTFINQGAGTTAISDANPNAVVGGIALIGTTGDGLWEYSLDGTTFQAVWTVSNSSALLLPGNATLRYVPNGQNAEMATITYLAWDATSGTAGGQADLSATDATGGATAFSAVSDTASLIVTLVNHAPVLTPANPSLGSTTATTVDTFALSKFINASGGTTITDVDQGAVVGGIALTGVTSSGAWSYSLDGTTFASVGTVSNSLALLLPSTAELRYTPNGTTAETATITYRAWDTTTGTSGGTADTTTNGGATAFSTTTDTASLAVTTNAAPVLTPASPSLGNTLPTAAKTISLAGTFINNGTGTTTITDSDTGAVVGGIAVVGVTGKGTWAYSLDGTTYTSITSVSTTAALLLPNTATLRYTPDGKDSETATITYCAWDTTSGTSGGTADTTTNGGTTAFSTATDTASLTVASGSISGFVYIDSAEDGLRIDSNGMPALAIQGVVITLLQEDTSSGSWNTVTMVMTGADGSYSFNNLAPGTYQITKTQPADFIDGIVTLGTIGGATTGTAGTDEFNLTLTVGGNGSEYNFGEYGLIPGIVSLRMCLASSPLPAQFVVQLDTAPVVSLSSSTAGNGYSTTYTSGGAAATIAASDATVTDADGSMLAGMTATIANRPDGDSETLAATTTGTSITSTYADGVLTLSGVASLADYQQVLTTIAYSDTASSPTAGARTINVVVNDGVLSSDAATATVTVAAATGLTGYSITANDSLIGAAEDASTGFTFAGATVGDTYSYTVTSSGGTATVTGSGTITSATQQVTGINVSTLSDGTLTYSVKLTNTASQTGAAATATAVLDTTAPTGYSITAGTSVLNATENTAASFTFAGAEVGATYNYIVTSDGGSGSVTGSGTISSATQQVAGINVSSLPDGAITYSVRLTDPAGNSGAYVAATATLDTTAPKGYTITADQSLIDASNASAASFTFANAEEFTIYNYTVTSSGGGTPVTGTGTVLTSTQQVTSINVSSLPDGTLTYSATLTDTAGNVGAAATAQATLDAALAQTEDWLSS